MKKIKNRIIILSIISLGMMCKSSILFSQVTKFVIDSDTLWKYDAKKNSFLPIKITGLAKKQQKSYSKKLHGKLQKYCGCNPDNFKIDVGALRQLIQNFKNDSNNNFQYIQVQLCEINPDINSHPYYQRNKKKLHFLFYVLDGNKKQIVNNAFDLCSDVTSLNHNRYYQVPDDDITRFISSFRNNSLKIFKSIGPKFKGNEVGGLQFVNMKLNEIEDVLTDVSNFTEFNISLALIKLIDKPDPSSPNASDYSSFDGMNNILNLHFQKRYPLNTQGNMDFKYYDLNDLCPPGNGNLD